LIASIIASLFPSSSASIEYFRTPLDNFADHEQQIWRRFGCSMLLSLLLLLVAVVGLLTKRYLLVAKSSMVDDDLIDIAKIRSIPHRILKILNEDNINYSHTPFLQ
jgi:hypothetical protein